MHFVGFLTRPRSYNQMTATPRNALVPECLQDADVERLRPQHKNAKSLDVDWRFIAKKKYVRLIYCLTFL